MNMQKLNEYVREQQEIRKEALKTNPRYDIDRRTDKNGNITLYFPGGEAESFIEYQSGTEVIASTERFLPDDIMFPVPNSHVLSIQSGGTLAYIQKPIEGGRR